MLIDAWNMVPEMSCWRGRLLLLWRIVCVCVCVNRGIAEEELAAYELHIVYNVEAFPPGIQRALLKDQN